MTPARLTELRAIESRMTKGPWTIEHWHRGEANEDCYAVFGRDSQDARKRFAVTDIHEQNGADKENAHGIAAIRNAAKEMLDEIERLQRIEAAARERIAFVDRLSSLTCCERREVDNLDHFDSHPDERDRIDDTLRSALASKGSL